MRILFMVIVLSVLLSSVASATLCEDLMSELDIQVGTKFADAVPYKTDVFNIYTLDVEPIGHISLEDRTVMSIDCNLTDEPTFNVYINGIETVRGIKAADSQIDAFDDAISAGDIKIQGVTAMKAVKGFFTRVGIKIASWFG